MNRCSGFTKNNIKCRAKTKDNKLFCCINHEPINRELIDNCCFMCMEKVIKSNDIIFFQCKHAFHKSCYLEWLTFSKYEDNICIICRKNVSTNKITNTKKKLKTTLIDSTKIKNILNILNQNIHTSIAYNTGYSGYTGPFMYTTDPISYNTGHTGPLLYNTGHTGPLLYNIGHTGPLLYNIGHTGPTDPLLYNIEYTYPTEQIPYNTGHTENINQILYNNYIIPNEIILNIDEDY